MKSDTLLFEIGAEEIPAGYIAPALAALQQAMAKQLTDARIACGDMQTFGTPRRLAIIINDVALKQEDITEKLMGPPARIGVDENGRFTVAAQKFAEKAGLSADALRMETTPKGDYLCADKKEKGLATIKVLADMLPKIIESLPFPKTMRWADLNEQFARPVINLAAMLGKIVVRFTWAGITSGAGSYGHPFMAPAKIKLAHPDQYLVKLKDAYVWVDIAERRKLVEKEIYAAAESLGGTVLPDEELIDIVTNMVECPVAAAGRFDDKFLELPQEVLITAMRSHQKYFAVQDNSGNLMPCFIAVNNTRAVDMNKVAAGHERVLRARLEDAMFFYRNDLEIPLAGRVEQLQRVLFQADLGSVYDKVKRVQALVPLLAAGDLATVTDRAAQLCKADLVTHVVIEFPKLQGVIGRVYAKKSGEPEAVAIAIEEHYRPTYSGAVLPETPAGALLAIADKMDTICGCFAVGLIPSGTSDPYALRRQGIGIIQILADQDLRLSLKTLIKKGVEQFSSLPNVNQDDTIENIYQFISGRMAQLLVDEGLPRDIVTAVLNASADQVPDVWQRARALAAMRARPDFEPLAVAFKRVANIIKKSGAESAAAVNESLFEHPSESALYAACADVAGKVDSALTDRAYEQALVEISALREPVDRFFDDVMVMSEDTALRANRLALLETITAIFSGFADFSAVTTE